MLSETVFVTLPANVDPESKDLINPEIIGRVVGWKPEAFQMLNPETQTSDLRVIDRILVTWRHAPCPAFTIFQNMNELYALDPEIYGPYIEPSEYDSDDDSDEDSDDANGPEILQETIPAEATPA